MPKHTKNAADRSHHTYHEKSKYKLGSLSARLGSDSQLPFGYCCLSLQPIADGDAVVSPSGHIYGREAILEYLLEKTQEIKEEARLFEEERLRKDRQDSDAAADAARKQAEQFAENENGVECILKKRKISSSVDCEVEQRKKIIDEKSDDVRMQELKAVNPWCPNLLLLRP